MYYINMNDKTTRYSYETLSKVSVINKMYLTHKTGYKKAIVQTA